VIYSLGLVVVMLYFPSGWRALAKLARWRPFSGAFLEIRKVSRVQFDHGGQGREPSSRRANCSD
jgi:hypothetical protein